MPDPAALIADLKAAGLSRADIVRRAGVSKSTVSRLVNDDSRDHLQGTVDRIGELHERVVGGANLVPPPASGSQLMFHGKPGGR